MNIATVFTLSRIFCAPYIAFLILEHRFLEALIWLAFASMTDVLDGAIARAFEQQTVIGSWLDPLADKILMLGVFYSLWYSTTNLIPTWFVVCMVIKECVLITAVCIVRLTRKPLMLRASVCGKAAMLLQVAIALHCIMQHVLFGVAQLAGWILYSTIMVAFVALFDYGIQVYRSWYLKSRGGV